MYVPSNLGHTTNSFEATTAAVMAQAAPIDDDDGVVAHAVFGCDSSDSGDDVAEKLWSAAIQSGTIPAEDASTFPTVQQASACKLVNNLTACCVASRHHNGSVLVALLVAE